MSTSSEKENWEKIEYFTGNDLFNEDQNLTNQQIDSNNINLKLNDQQTSQSNQSATTNETSSKINQINHLVYELDWSFRDELILYLNASTSQLHGEPISTDAKDKLMKENVDLYANLINLPLKLNKPNEHKEENNHQLKKIVLDLSWTLGSKIIDVLIANHNLANLIGDSISTELKMKLIKHNNNLISNLLHLKVRIIECSSMIADPSLVNNEANKRICHSKTITISLTFFK